MLTCIRKCFDLVAQHHGERWELATIPQEVPEVYDMLCRGDSLGVFQVESRAQMNMLPRLKPRCFYDLVIEVAIVRPGPIQGDMVHPYLKRRSGKEPVTFPCPDPEHGPPDELEQILGRTLGVPIFQEQAMKIALDAAKFTSEEANQLRKAMATFRSKGNIEAAAGQDGRADGRARLRSRFRAALLRPDQGLRRIWLPRKPRGELRAPRLRVELAEVEISGGVRLRFAQLAADGLLRAGADRPRCARAWRRGARGRRQSTAIGTARWRTARCASACARSTGCSARRRIGSSRVGPTQTVEELRSRGGVPVHAIQRLAAADAFRSMGLDRRAALWDSRALKQAPDLPLFAYAEARDEGSEASRRSFPAMPLSEHVVNDYQTIRLCLKAHPMRFLREHYAAQKFVTADQLTAIRDGKRLSIAGLVLIRQRPGSAKGVVFITIEDETGVANLVVWPDVFEKQRKIVMGARLMAVHGDRPAATPTAT